MPPSSRQVLYQFVCEDEEAQCEVVYVELFMGEGHVTTDGRKRERVRDRVRDRVREGERERDQ